QECRACAKGVEWLTLRLLGNLRRPTRQSKAMPTKMRPIATATADHTRSRFLIWTLFMAGDRAMLTAAVAWSAPRADRQRKKERSAGARTGKQNAPRPPERQNSRPGARGSGH